MLTVRGSDVEVAVALTPVRALELARELIQPAVVSIKVDRWGRVSDRRKHPDSPIRRSGYLAIRACSSRSRSPPSISSVFSVISC